MGLDVETPNIWMFSLEERKNISLVHNACEHLINCWISCFVPTLRRNITKLQFQIIFIVVLLQVL